MITKTQRKWMLMAIGIFLFTSLLAVTLNSLRYGWHWGYSISRYVGLETWSAVLFALGNIGVAALFGKYLYAVSETWQMSRWFYVVIVVTAMALLGLSACPIGYFDLPGANYGSSAPSQIHQICSRLMFACMLLMAFVWQLSGKVHAKTRCFCAVFVVYGVICVVAYLMEWDWFFRTLLVFESAYILGFMVLCWRLQGNKTNQERISHGRPEARN